jgi:gamma-glutamyltranspeptidase/glutathione hydrolase
MVGTYLPASGATVIQTLHILEHFDLAAVAGTAQWVDIVAQALLLAFEDRESVQGTLSEQAATITSKARAAELAKRIRRPADAGDATDASSQDVTTSPNTTAFAASTMSAESREAPFTTHLSVMDGNGMSVALTQSVGPNMGSRVATEGLGFLYAATMGYLGDLRPGQRPWSSQAPTIVLEDGEPHIVIGGAGARRIISAMVQTLARAIDEEITVEQALAAPRFHVSGRTLYLERRAGTSWSEQVEDRLTAVGWEVEPRADAPYFARLNAVARDRRSGEMRGLPDPRWPGKAAYAR